MNRRGVVLAALVAFVTACGGNSSPYDARELKAYPSDRKQHIEAAGVVLQDKIWLISGSEGSESNGCECGDDATATVDIYDPKTDSWSSGPSVNHPRHSYPNAFLVGDTVYLVGGICPGDDFHPPIEKLAPPYTCPSA